MLRSVRHRPTSLAFPNSFSRDCLETPDGHQTGATQADTEGRGDRIFALQASDLASLTPLQPTFQTVSLESVWKVPDGVDRLFFGERDAQKGLSFSLFGPAPGDQELGPAGISQKV